VNWESGVVPVRPWPRSCDSDEEGGFGFSSSEGSASRESEGESEGQLGVPGELWRGSHIVSRGASKKASR